MKTWKNIKIDAVLMLESMTESVLLTTTDLSSPGPYIIYVNPAFAAMTGWAREEVIGKSPRILQGPETEYGIFYDLREKLENGDIWSGRTINYKKSGESFYMQWSIVPIKNSAGEVHQYLAVQKDVTHLVHTEKNLKKSRREERRSLKVLKKTNKKLEQLIEKQKETLALFVKFVPEPVVKRALLEHHQNIMEGEQLEVGLLFCDIRRFTSLAERLNPKETVHLLNVYYSMMSDVIKKYNGVINQFVGDEIFVSFGAPLPIPDAEQSAVACAVEMVARLKEINEALRAVIHEDIIVGIGINYGPIIAGNLGSDDRLSYSITGDAVNTAKRIETLSKKIPNGILISRQVYEKVKNNYKTKPLGDVEIKGKNEKVSVFQVLHLR